MDVLTEQALRTGAEAQNLRASPSQVPLYAAALAYAVLLGAAVSRHEPWVDEAQSWLLARDAGLFDLWTRLLHYEGTTGLWQTLLHLLIRVGLPYWGMNVFSGLLGLAGVCVLLWRAPFPAAIRIALPFTFYLAYQYAVIARSYDLLPVLLFVCAVTYSKVTAKPLLFTTLLCLLAAVSVHGMVLAMAAGVSALISSPDRKRLVPYLLGFVAVSILLAALAWPAHDGTFIAGINLSFDHLVEISRKALDAAFTGEPISSLLVIGLSIPLLWRGGGWLFFAVSAVLLSVIASLVYSQLWHHGILFLAWLFALWISADRQSARRDHLSYKLAMVSLAIVAAVQCYWTVRSIGYDWDHAYSGSLQAARGLHQLNLQNKKLYGVGFACIAIEPYFPQNIFANVNDGGTEAYWDWSRRNHVNLDSEHLAETRPAYVIVGFKNESERGIWEDLVRKSGYRIARHFEGSSFWQTSVFEPESYDLFERSPAP